MALVGKPDFIMLAGPPCQGKSTFIKNTLEGKCEFVTLSTDKFLEATGNYNKAISSMFSQAQKTMYEELESAVKDFKHIVWDQTNLTSRVRLLKLSEIPNEYNKMLVWFKPLTFEQLMERNNARNLSTGKFIPEAVVRNMLSTFEPPSDKEKELFDDILIVEPEEVGVK